ncbi:MAG: carbamoyl transferase [Candidatus Staskawiczbacteria bacterium RIFCSPLOWO2_01_FULL_40_39]|uniref:Carbamoyl transferase n=1 Tax=Candidatus Staskawiczbacteria bacterium RIFCSPHIGHO2_01_FULL_39_25 TaxID=1802202 RepID=A0A1G2HN62_9BACT|nr:MAG: carbamoyl transferase [Candidatus Staskawiczbacteria bacterium RIFCSPHIGHO2_01_FULL_39_25]OGZ73331.1 MAG: carbamoyl transferase [Candidatus Staskawiczbacteria bacterium RIFCSPLOWO2_01_FULL_40_39]
MKKPTYILGLNFAYHELSACIIKNGKLLAAVEEERFSRIKRGKQALINNPDVLPKEAINYCLDIAQIPLKRVNYIGLSFSPKERLKNINVDSYYMPGNWGSERGERLFYKKITRVPLLLNHLAGEDLSRKIRWIPHHICHASSAFFVSPFSKSAILSIDGIGELSSTWMGYGKNNAIQVLKEIYYPNSLGFLWEKISKYLGFTEYDASKIMGLAAYGNPRRFYKIFQKIVQLKADGEFTVDNSIMRFRMDDFSQLEDLFKTPKEIRRPLKPTKNHKDIAAALQAITDDVVIHLVTFLSKKTGSKNICLAGGVALNCVSNSLLLKNSICKNLYVQPAANDAGTALGAAYYIWHQELNKPRSFIMENVYWGPKYSDLEIISALKKFKISSYKKTTDITEKVAEKLSEGKIIGWFQGREEWGPRALGNRSLLADPRRKDMKEILNERIKRRESFRPFAPSVLKEFLSSWFKEHRWGKSLSAEFMEVNFDAKKIKQKKIPSVIHIDGTGRLQVVSKKTNPLYHKLIYQFYKRTGVPIVLNTSFNDNEPIVCSPEDAIKTFKRTKMDYLAIGNYLVSK